MKRSALARSAFLLIAWLSADGLCLAEDASSAWRKVLQKCAKSDVIGKQSLFFGLSNGIGPGSVWRFADDKSIRLLFELSDAIPSETDRFTLIRSNNVVG